MEHRPAAQRRDGQGRRHHPYGCAGEEGANRTPPVAPRARATNVVQGPKEQDAHGDGVLSFRSGGRPLAFSPPHPWANRTEHVEEHHAAVFAPMVLAGEPSFGRAVEDDNGTRNALQGWSPNEVAEAGRYADARASCLPLVREVGCRAAAGKGSNFVVSPLSFHAALALVAAGTRGETQSELLGFLGSSSLAELHRAATTQLVASLHHLHQTSFACGVWVDRNWALTPEFMDAAASRYAAVAEPVDFVSQPEQARQRVNAFVADATKGLIRDVLPSGSVNPLTVVVLANALYFKGMWSLPFDPRATIHAPFHLLDGTAVPAPFMRTAISFERHVAAFPGFTALKLPYKNDGDGVHKAEFCMLLLLPDESAALKLTDLYDKVVTTPEFIKKHTPAAKVPVGRFLIPKFKFSFKFEASSDMRKLGVTRAFVGGDFSGMVTRREELFIAGAYHQATIEVDELGTVAAAATAVVFQQQCLSARPPMDFVADRPFLFAVVEEITGAVLFLGHVVNPLAE